MFAVIDVPHDTKRPLTVIGVRRWAILALALARRMSRFPIGRAHSFVTVRVDERCPGYGVDTTGRHLCACARVLSTPQTLTKRGRR